MIISMVKKMIGNNMEDKIKERKTEGKETR